MDCQCSDEKLTPKQFALCAAESTCRLDCQAKGKATGECRGWNCKCQSTNDIQNFNSEYWNLKKILEKLTSDCLSISQFPSVCLSMSSCLFVCVCVYLPVSNLVFLPTFLFLCHFIPICYCYINITCLCHNAFSIKYSKNTIK